MCKQGNWREADSPCCHNMSDFGSLHLDILTHTLSKSCTCILTANSWNLSASTEAAKPSWWWEMCGPKWGWTDRWAVHMPPRPLSLFQPGCRPFRGQRPSCPLAPKQYGALAEKYIHRPRFYFLLQWCRFNEKNVDWSLVKHLIDKAHIINYIVYLHFHMFILLLRVGQRLLTCTSHAFWFFSVTVKNYPSMRTCKQYHLK